GASRVVDRASSSTVDIHVVRVDDVVPRDRHVSILQLDVEGHEYPALLGAMETIARCRPLIILEDNAKIIEGDWFRETILEGLGYRVSGHVHWNNICEPVTS
ncbi:MAG: FkbM family methyltransferase, partial [Myxococcales bacterium]|nr:FkbM family methyltransferase [Myxococcales bacterium]